MDWTWFVIIAANVVIAILLIANWDDVADFLKWPLRALFAHRERMLELQLKIERERRKQWELSHPPVKDKDFYTVDDVVVPEEQSTDYQYIGIQEIRRQQKET